jgi:branched-chain amino acid transport system ATP-binding protein
VTTPIDRRVEDQRDIQETAIRVRDLSGGYGHMRILRDVSFDVYRGEVTGLVGPNGAGKSTLFRLMFGLTTHHGGTVALLGRDVTGMPYQHRLQGVGWVPEGRVVFENLTVLDNLWVAAKSQGDRTTANARVAAALDMFPDLADRTHASAAVLSGGQRQMLALARALVLDPDLLILDEPSLGLAPIILGKLREVLDEIKRQGQTIVIAEQQVSWIRGLVDRALVMRHGAVVAEGDGSMLASDERLAEYYLGP